MLLGGGVWCIEVLGGIRCLFRFVGGEVQREVEVSPLGYKIKSMFLH